MDKIKPSRLDTVADSEASSRFDAERVENETPPRQLERITSSISSGAAGLAKCPMVLALDAIKGAGPGPLALSGVSPAVQTRVNEKSPTDFSSVGFTVCLLYLDVWGHFFIPSDSIGQECVKILGNSARGAREKRGRRFSMIFFSRLGPSFFHLSMKFLSPIRELVDSTRNEVTRSEKDAVAKTETAMLLCLRILGLAV